MKFLQTIKHIKSSLFSFYANWNDGKYPNVPDGHKLKYSLILVFVLVIIMIPYGFIFSILEEYRLIDLSDHLIDDLFDQYSYDQMILFGAVVAPVLEEGIFRGFITFRRFYPLLLYVDFRTANKKNRVRVLLKVRRLWDRIFPAIVISSSLLFGYIHITNFGGEVAWWLVPFLVLPQIIVGFVFAFVRIKFGLIWSIFNHATYNFLLLSLSYLFR